MQRSDMSAVMMLGDDARKTLVSHLDKIAQAIGSTLGPGGRPFGFDKYNQELRLSSTFSKDGLTVLRALRFPGNPAAQAVLHYCAQAASHSVLASGDGTSSSIVLASAVANAILNDKCKWPQALARELESDAERAISAIRNEAIMGDDIVKKVALTSTNGDEELTDVVIAAVNQSSAFGSILTVKNPSGRSRYLIDRQDGYSYCKGYDYNQVFATSASPMAASSKPIEWDNPYVLLFNGHLILGSQVTPILQAYKNAVESDSMSRCLVIVAHEVGDEAANKLLIFNREAAKLGLAVFIIKPRMTAEVNCSLQVLRDIASFCGISENSIIDGGNYKEMNASDFGTCSKVKIGPMYSAFLGRAKNHWIETRIEQNASIMQEARSEFDKEITSIRNAELAEGLVKVEIGCGLLPELEEREHRFDDASKAAQACMKNGALPGCGLSYIRAAKLSQAHPHLERAFRSIYESIMLNYGHDIDQTLFPFLGQGIRIDKMNILHGNAVDLGVLDATDTICSVIKNGVALGVTVATIGGYVYREKTDEQYSC